MDIFSELEFSQEWIDLGIITPAERGSYLEVQEALDHENAAPTRVCVQWITVKADEHGRKLAGSFRAAIKR